MRPNPSVEARPNGKPPGPALVCAYHPCAVSGAFPLVPPRLERRGHMTIRDLSHRTFIERDLERTSELFRKALGAAEVYDSGDRQFSLAREKFSLLGGVW